MTVKELIKALEGFPQDHEVVVEALDSGEPSAICWATSDNYYKRRLEDDGDGKKEWSGYADSTITIGLQI